MFFFSSMDVSTVIKHVCIELHIRFVSTMQHHRPTVVVRRLVSPKVSAHSFSTHINHFLSEKAAKDAKNMFFV